MTSTTASSTASLAASSGRDAARDRRRRRARRSHRRERAHDVGVDSVVVEARTGSAAGSPRRGRRTRGGSRGRVDPPPRRERSHRLGRLRLGALDRRSDRNAVHRRRPRRTATADVRRAGDVGYGVFEPVTQRVLAEEAGVGPTGQPPRRSTIPRRARSTQRRAEPATSADGSDGRTGRLRAVRRHLRPLGADRGHVRRRRGRQRPVAGFRSILAPLAADTTIRLGRPVQRIEQGSDGVTVTGEGWEESGTHVVITVPLGVLNSGAIESALPLLRSGKPSSTGPASATWRRSPGFRRTVLARQGSRAAALDHLSGRPPRGRDLDVGLRALPDADVPRRAQCRCDDVARPDGLGARAARGALRRTAPCGATGQRPPTGSTTSTPTAPTRTSDPENTRRTSSPSASLSTGSASPVSTPPSSAPATPTAR